MEVGHCIDRPQSQWRRCKSAKVEGDSITWVLNESGGYEFLDAYCQKPHRELIAATSDDTLLVFVRKWGPLWRLTAVGRDSFQSYRSARDFLTATVRLMAATGSQSEAGQRAALLELKRLEEFPPNPFHTFLGLKPEWDQLLSDPGPWFEMATAGEVDKLCVEFINEFPLTSGPRFVIDDSGPHRAVRAGLFINDLMQALIWMIWQDIFLKKAYTFCGECGKLIWSDSQHVRKFCSDSPCGRRKTDRESKRRKRATAKKQASTNPEMAAKTIQEKS